MSIMSNTPLPAILGPSSAIPDRGEEGGGRAPAGSASHKIRPPTVPTLFFKIPDQGDLLLQRHIIGKINFHILVFNFIDPIEGGTH